jgi:hypothetical protein
MLVEFAISGDGVNVAARIDAICDPENVFVGGDLWLSRTPCPERYRPASVSLARKVINADFDAGSSDEDLVGRSAIGFWLWLFPQQFQRPARHVWNASPLRRPNVVRDVRQRWATAT